VTGHYVSVAVLERVGLGSALCDQLLELVRRVRQLRLDANEYICLKYIILLNSGTQTVIYLSVVIETTTTTTSTSTTVLQPFVRDYPGESVPER